MIRNPYFHKLEIKVQSDVSFILFFTWKPIQKREIDMPKKTEREIDTNIIKRKFWMWFTKKPLYIYNLDIYKTW